MCDNSSYTNLKYFYYKSHESQGGPHGQNLTQFM